MNRPLSRSAFIAFILSNGILVAAPPNPARFNTPPRDFAQSAATYTITTGDFNNDGNLDIVTVDSNSSVGEMRLGKGNGTFEPAMEFYPGTSPGALAVGDFNGDGNLDILAAPALLLGNGDGTFQPPVSIGLPIEAGFVAVADFNRDGKLDIVEAAIGGRAIYYLAGNGNGTFQSPLILTLPLEVNGLTVADVNLDGVPDVLCTFGIDSTIRGDVGVALGNGDGTFQPFQSFKAEDYPNALVTGDFNGDGKPDVIVVDAVVGVSNQQLTFLAGDGTGSFGAPQNVASVGGTASLAVGDFNHDGKLDVAVGNPGTAEVAVFLGDGDGTFQPALLPAVIYGGHIIAADLNHDGNLDVISGNSNLPDISILFGLGNGRFAQAPVIASAIPATNLSTGDVNGDGRPDLVVVAKSGAIEAVLGNGDGTFQPPVYSPSLTGANTLTLADCNGDGKADAVISKLDGLAVQLSNGDGTFGAAIPVLTGAINNASTAGDFNGDGKIDLVVGSRGSSDVLVLLGNGDGTFQAPIQSNAGVYIATTFAKGDFNGDGNLDLVVGETVVPTLTVLLGKGDGTFSRSVPVSLPSGDFNGSIAVGDINHDGKLDIAIAVDSLVYVYLGNGNGTFQPPASYSAAQFLSGLALADMNLDGNLDLVGVTTGNYLVVLPGLGDGTFEPVVNGSVFYGTPLSPLSLAIADSNLDGKPDAAVLTAAEISLFTNTTH